MKEIFSGHSKLYLFNIFHFDVDFSATFLLLKLFFSEEVLFYLTFHLGFEFVITSWDGYLDSTQPFPPVSQALLGMEQPEIKQCLSVFCLPRTKHYEEHRKGIEDI